jgi:iron complex outermembrane receptor protein
VLWGAVLGGAVLLTGTGETWSQEGPPAIMGQVENVVVTATRREERLQDVPIAVTALTASALERQQVFDVSALQRAAPNILVLDFGGRASSSRIGLRGPFNNDAIISVDNPVGLYLDGVYIARNAGANMNFLDVERVEVLRGPQGTLFGRNTIGGAVSITTQRPTDDFEGWIQGSYGNFDAWNVSGMVNVPLGEKAGLRIVAQHDQRDGFVRSALTGQDLSDKNQEYVRAGLSLDISDDWNLYLSGDYTHDENNGTWLVLTGTFPIVFGLDYIGLATGGMQSGADFIDPFSKTTQTQYQYFRGWTAGGSATLTGQIGEATFKSITGYRKNREANASDTESSPFSFVYTLPGSERHAKQFSEEVQLYGTAFGDRLDWIVGAYYFRETGEESTPYVALWPVFGTFGQSTLGSARNTSMGAFAQFTYSITQTLRATAGIRYTHDERSIVSRNYIFDAGPGPDPVAGPPIACAFDGVTPAEGCAVASPKAKFDYTPFTLGLDYRPIEDLLLYAKFSRGYRAGGYNLRATDRQALNTFTPERLNSWEIGEKAELFDRRLRLNVNAYYDTYKNIQLSTVVVFPGSVAPTAVIGNFGDARIWGVEAEATAVLGNLTLTGSLGTAKAKYTRLDPTTGLAPGQPFPYTPKVTGYIGADYEIPASFGSVNLHVDGSYRGRVVFATTTFGATSPLTTAPSYWLLNAVVTVRLEGMGVEVSAWGRNLGNKHYFSEVGDLTAAFFTYAHPGDPRTYGFTVRKTF